MKIDFLMSSLIGGGAERVLVTLANGLAEQHNIKVITFNEGLAYQLSKKIDKVNLHGGVISNHTIRSVFNLLGYYTNRRNKPDVLIAFLPSNSLIAIIVAKILAIKVIVSEHTNHTAPSTKKKQRIRKYFYKYANATTVLTKFDYDYYKNFGANVVIMPNPLNLPSNCKPLSKRDKNILVAGSLNRYSNKGFDSFLKLMTPILLNNPDWKIQVAGDGDDGLQILKNIALKNKINHQVEFLGFVKSMEKVYQNSQIFVLSSKFEGLPMALMEALSNGVACVSYDCPSGPSELINNSENGLLIPDQNSKAMQQAIQSLVKDNELRNILAYNAPNSMLKYGLDSILKKWEELILSIN